MKVRMIIGEYEEYDDEGPVPQAFLQTVAFPMEMPYRGDDPEHSDTVTLQSEEELKEWAEAAFASYEIWDMEVPRAAVVDQDEQADVLLTQELAEAPVEPSTGHDEAMTQIKESLEEVRAVLVAAWNAEDVCVDDYALAEEKLPTLIEAAGQQDH